MSASLRAGLLLVILVLALAAIYLFIRHRGQGDRPFDRVLDPNTASAADLDQVPWLTPHMAEGMVSGRPWTNLNDLVEVNGIGVKTLEKILPYLEIQR